MRTSKRLCFLVWAGILFSACGTAQPQTIPVEVTRIVPEIQIATVEVTRLVPKYLVITVVVERPVQATAVPTPTPPLEMDVDVTQAISMLVSRAMHTATRLADGRILLAGGSRSPDEHLAEVEIVDPATGNITQAASLHTPRHEHSATLLQDGRVLVVGGYNLQSQWLDDAEVYDPAANTWTVSLLPTRMGSATPPP